MLEDLANTTQRSHSDENPHASEGEKQKESVLGACASLADALRLSPKERNRKTVCSEVEGDSITTSPTIVFLKP